MSYQTALIIISHIIIIIQQLMINTALKNIKSKRNNIRKLKNIIELKENKLEIEMINNKLLKSQKFGDTTLGKAINNVVGKTTKYKINKEYQKLSRKK